jgi:putative endonuclease
MVISEKPIKTWNYTVSKQWVVYMILCSDNSLYTGITNDLPRRFSQHSISQGAKFFRSRQPIKVVYAEAGHNRSTASKREFAIKKLKPAKKLLLIASELNIAHTLLP